MWRWTKVCSIKSRKATILAVYQYESKETGIGTAKIKEGKKKEWNFKMCQKLYIRKRKRTKQKIRLIVNWFVEKEGFRVWIQAVSYIEVLKSPKKGCKKNRHETTKCGCLVMEREKKDRIRKISPQMLRTAPQSDEYCRLWIRFRQSAKFDFCWISVQNPGVASESKNLMRLVDRDFVITRKVPK